MLTLQERLELEVELGQCCDTCLYSLTSFYAEPCLSCDALDERNDRWTSCTGAVERLGRVRAMVKEMEGAGT
jgi:hypothetical protein